MVQGDSGGWILDMWYSVIQPEAEQLGAAFLSDPGEQIY